MTRAMERPVKGRFVAASAGVHLLLALLSAVVINVPQMKTPDIIQVHVITEAVPAANDDFQYGKIIDVPPPQDLKEKAPPKADALASFNARAKAPGAARLHLDNADMPPAFKAAQAQKESERRKSDAEKPKSSSERKTPVAENRFSALAMSPDKSDQPGRETRSPVDDGAKPDRETKEEVRALTDAEIDSFAAANPAGTMETGREAIVPLNTRKFAYIDYFSGIKQGIEKIWAYPYEAMNSGAGGSTVLRFTLTSDGQLDEVRVIASAGLDALDNAAVVAVRNSAPYGPFPPAMNKERIHIVATFTYQPSFSKVP